MRRSPRCPAAATGPRSPPNAPPPPASFTPSPPPFCQSQIPAPRLYWHGFEIIRATRRPRAMSDPSFGAIESSLQEGRVFPPPAHFAAGARINSREEFDQVYRQSIDQPEEFWGRAARGAALVPQVGQGAGLERRRREVVRRRADQRRYNCLDRQVELGRGEKTAILWEGEPRRDGRARGGSVAPDHLPAAPGRRLPVRQRAEEARRQEGRPRHDLHADGARGRRWRCSPAPGSARRTR